MAGIPRGSESCSFWSSYYCETQQSQKVRPCLNCKEQVAEVIVCWTYCLSILLAGCLLLKPIVLLILQNHFYGISLSIFNASLKQSSHQLIRCMLALSHPSENYHSKINLVFFRSLCQSTGIQKQLCFFICSCVLTPLKFVVKTSQIEPQIDNRKK